MFHLFLWSIKPRWTLASRESQESPLQFFVCGPFLTTQTAWYHPESVGRIMSWFTFRSWLDPRPTETVCFLWLGWGSLPCNASGIDIHIILILYSYYTHIILILYIMLHNNTTTVYTIRKWICEIARNGGNHVWPFWIHVDSCHVTSSGGICVSTVGSYQPWDHEVVGLPSFGWLGFAKLGKGYNIFLKSWFMIYHDGTKTPSANLTW